MFEFAFEGALFAFIVSGDRFVLFALLPRRKPRTAAVQLPYRPRKGLNLTGGGYSDSRVSWAAGPDFMLRG